MINFNLPDLVCFSHLRWNFVYQRPQHLMTRYPGRVFYIEEPVFTDANDWLVVHHVPDEHVRVVTPQLQVNGEGSTDDRLQRLIDDLLATEQIETYIAWYYSPMALKFSDHLDPLLTVYDCMDELSAFKFAPPELVDLERQLLQKANLVFTGGNSLFEAKRHLHTNMYSFPSSIDKALFRLARTEMEEFLDQRTIPHPRLGFYGVLDERFDIELVEEVARLRPDWHIVLIGPVVKIDPATLPTHDNIHYLGAKRYPELPAYLSGWDIAIMPFAINDATRFISPTKTPEYLCGGKRVVSTPIRDVISDYAQDGLVDIAANATEFIAAAERALQATDHSEWLRAVDEKLSHNSWDITWEQMYALINSAINRKILSTKTLAHEQNELTQR